LVEDISLLEVGLFFIFDKDFTALLESDNTSLVSRTDSVVVLRVSDCLSGVSVTFSSALTFLSPVCSIF
jgi:hypothetical protein